MYNHGPMYQMLVKFLDGIAIEWVGKNTFIKMYLINMSSRRMFKQYIFNGPFEVIGVYLSCKHLTIPVSPAFFAGGRRRAVIQE